MGIWPFSRKTEGPITRALDPDAVKLVTQEVAKQFHDYNSLFLTGQETGLGRTGVENAYSDYWVAYAAIRRIAQDASAVPLLFLNDPDDPDDEVPADHPTRRMFENPNPYFSMSEFMQWLFTMLNRRGEFFITFDDPIRPTQMMQFSDPLHWRDILDGVELAGWYYQYSTVQASYLPSELITCRLIDPRRPYRGQTPLQAAVKSYAIDTQADTLTANVIARGGEKSLIFAVPNEATPTQREQALSMLRARRAGDATVGRDVLLPNGITPVDPKFIEDDMGILEAQALQPDKVCAVYGVPKSLLGYEDIDKYATWNGRKRSYYENTLQPLAKAVTDSFDKMFVETLTSPYRCYVRFDWDAVAALQGDLAEKFDMAGKAHAAGLPWATLDERFNLGLDLKTIPGADTVMVPQTVAPLDKLLEEWEEPPEAPAQEPPPPLDLEDEDPDNMDEGGDEGPPPSTPAGGPSGGRPAEGEGDPPAKAPTLTNALIRKRAGDSGARLRREVRIHKMEVAMRKEWKAVLTRYAGKAAAAAKQVHRVNDIPRVLKPIFDAMAKELAALANRYHGQAAAEGEMSVLELTEGKLDDMQRAVYLKAIKWRPEVEVFLAERTNYIVGLYDEAVFMDIQAAVSEAVIAGREVSHVQHVIRDRMRKMPGGINRATTIARTEVGTAYNVARTVEMKGQGFEQHQWFTAGDELVRGNDPSDEFSHVDCQEVIRVIGKEFPCGLHYPMEPGGEAANVINCRCETIPVLPKDG